MLKVMCHRIEAGGFPTTHQGHFTCTSYAPALIDISKRFAVMGIPSPIVGAEERAMRRRVAASRITKRLTLLRSFSDDLRRGSNHVESVMPTTSEKARWSACEHDSEHAITTHGGTYNRPSAGDEQIGDDFDLTTAMELFLALLVAAPVSAFVISSWDKAESGVADHFLSVSSDAVVALM
jgi:hypothetical protein